MQGKTLEADRPTPRQRLVDRLAHASMYAAEAERCLRDALVLLNEKHEGSEGE